MITRWFSEASLYKYEGALKPHPSKTVDGSFMSLFHSLFENCLHILIFLFILSV